MRWRDRKRCPHVHLRGIYGDEIIAAGYKRLACLDCGRLLNGPVLIAVLRAGEATAIDAARQRLGSDERESDTP